MPSRKNSNILNERIKELEREQSRLLNIIASMKKTEDLHLRLFENMLHEVHVWEIVRDESGKIKTWRLVDANPAALKSWGMLLDEVVGKTAEEIFPGSDPVELFMPMIQKIFSEGKPRKWEHFFPSTNQVLQMVTIPFGEYFVSTGIDVSDEKKKNKELEKEVNRAIAAEEALRENEENVRLLLNSTAEAIYGVDTEGCCTFCNPACLKILGYESDTNLLGKNIHYLIHHHRKDGTEYPEEECKIYQAFRKGEGVHVDQEVLWRADGSSFDAEYTSYPIRKGEEVIGSVVAFHDITERKKAQNILIEAKRSAEEACKEKSDFLAKMSHEIRTPMTVFMSALEYLMELDKVPEHRKVLELADLSSKRLHTLIEEVLDFSKIEEHKLELDEETFDLRKCLQNPLKMMQPKANKKNLCLELEVSPEVPKNIVGDEYRLGQILLNLIGNAIKFTEEGRVKTTVTIHGNNLIFTVSDTGAGIPEDKLESIFEEFKQADNSITRKYGGAGLGLAICKGLVKLMGGCINVQSQLGQGSRFSFNIPIKNLTASTSLATHH